jgi:hypothetical protein
MRASMTASVAVIALSFAVPAASQTWNERGFISVNGAYQPTANDFSDRFEFEKDLETGTTEVDYPVKGGVVFDGGGGVRLWKGLGAGVAVSYFTHNDAAATSTRSPHPFFLNQFREVSGDTRSLSRTETAVHVQAMYFWHPAGPLRLVLSGGPTFFSVEQELVTAVQLVEEYPYDTAQFSNVTADTIKESKVAFDRGRRPGSVLARERRSRRPQQPERVGRRRRRFCWRRSACGVLTLPYNQADACELAARPLRGHFSRTAFWPRSNGFRSGGSRPTGTLRRWPASPSHRAPSAIS